MRNFTYDRTFQESDAQQILSTQKHQLARQQVIYLLCFLAVLVVLGIYMLSRMAYTFYDGYLELDEERQLSVMVYVPISDLTPIQDAHCMQVRLGAVRLDAQMDEFGVRVETLPDHLVRLFRSETSVVMARLSINRGQQIPSWMYLQGVPVKVRVRNWK